MRETGFRKLLEERQKAINSLVCVGLDPLASKLPPHMRSCKGCVQADDFRKWMTCIVDAAAPCASMFKPQSAHWEAIPGGIEALQDVIKHIHEAYPDIPVFMDCKRGDIARTQECYRIAEFDLNLADGMNFCPYMGRDCMSALVDEKHLGRALVGLCYTSNPSAREVQDAVLANGRPYWQQMAKWIMQWAFNLGVLKDAGLVMAAAYEFPKGSGQVYSEHLKQCRQLVGDKLWFLIPGIGTQGGYVEETIKASFAGWGSIAINSSSDIIFASSGEDFAEAAAKKAKELQTQCNETIEEMLADACERAKQRVPPSVI